jgi:hypothetical protein
LSVVVSSTRARLSEALGHLAPLTLHSCVAVPCPAPTLKTAAQRCSRPTPHRLLPHRTSCTLTGVPSMRSRIARCLPGHLAPPRRCRSPITPSPSKPAAIVDLELPTSRLPGARLMPHHPEPESQRGRRSYHRRGPGLPRISSHIPELFPMPPELIIHEPPPTPTSPEACMFEFAAPAPAPNGVIAMLVQPCHRALHSCRRAAHRRRCPTQQSPVYDSNGRAAGFLLASSLAQLGWQQAVWPMKPSPRD